tara:strand:- start:1828 stop:5586 length:3759 start_codon:yes stop_codon:yes gene_type:complete
MPRLIDDELFGGKPDSRAIDPDLIKGGLRSKQFATVIDLLGYGEIEGLRSTSNTNPTTTDSLNIGRDIFLDNTPLVNANGDPNFEDVEVFFRNGTDNQDPLSSFDTFGPDRVENTIPVGVEVTKNTSVSRSITGVQDANNNELIKLIRVSIQIPSLLQFTKEGDIRGTEVKISIKITENNGTEHNPVKEDSIKGKSQNPYVKDYEIVLESNNLQFPLTVTVTRNTEDSTDNKLANKTIFLSLTTIITEPQAYKGFAYVALRFNAQTFPLAFPKRMYRVKGTKIKIPHNGTVDLDNGAITYSGTFNGTFKADKEWSADPAWILYDLLTTDKAFGGPEGVIPEDSLDVFSFFQASKYASEIITDPITGIDEPRFSCNVILNTRQDAYTLINDLCSVMRATAFYSAGSLVINQDRPTNTTTNTSTPEYVFNNSNVGRDGFTYNQIGDKTKFTEVEVSYFDNDTQTLDFEFVDTNKIPALSGYIDKFGRIRKTLKSFACTSRGQANRLGRWFLYTNLKEVEVVTFSTSLEAGVVVRPSMVIGIADSLKQGIRMGGRIAGLSSSAGNSDIDEIISDGDIPALAQGLKTIHVVMPSAAAVSSDSENKQITLTRNIVSISGRKITLDAKINPQGISPNIGTVYSITSAAVPIQLYRVVGIEENNDFEYSISAIIHDPLKYGEIERLDTPPEPRTITTLIGQVSSPKNATVTEEIVSLRDRAVSRLTVAWEPVIGVSEYLLEYQFSDPKLEIVDNPVSVRVSAPTFEFYDELARLGVYQFVIKSYNSLGSISSDFTKVFFATSGKTANPAPIQNLTFEPIDERNIRLRFDKPTDPDVVHGGRILINYSFNFQGKGLFSQSNFLQAVAGNSTEAIVPHPWQGEYILKTEDDGGRQSIGETSVIVNRPARHALKLLEDKEHNTNPKFGGVKKNCAFNTTKNGLVSDLAVTSGFYVFSSALDVGSIQPVRLKSILKTSSYYPSTVFSTRTLAIDKWFEFDGTDDQAVNTNAKVLVATTDQDPNASTPVTYGMSTGLTEINKTNHGLKVGDNVFITFTSGFAQNKNIDHDFLVHSLGFRSSTGKFDDPDKFVVVTPQPEIGNIIFQSGNANLSNKFTPFDEFINGDFTARGFKFKCIFDISDPAQSIIIEELGFLAGLDRRTESSIENTTSTNGRFTSSSTTSTTVTFEEPFFTGVNGLDVAANSAKPAVSVSVENAQGGDFVEITNVTSTNFTVNIKNRDSSGNDSLVVRNFKYIALGFGRTY